MTHDQHLAQGVKRWDDCPVCNPARFGRASVCRPARRTADYPRWATKSRKGKDGSQ